MAAAAQNVSFTSPVADASHGPVPINNNMVTDIFSTVQGLSGWTIAFTILALLVAYDQVNYWIQKGSIAGPSFKMPFIGCVACQRQ